MNKIELSWVDTDINSIKGEDHLGIKNVAIQMADEMQYGITSITPRARYWALYCWLLHDFNQNGPKKKSMKIFQTWLKRQEWYFILANIAYSEISKENIHQLTGSTKGFEIWKSIEDPVAEQPAYVKTSLGGYPIYRTVMKGIGLIRTGAPEREIYNMDVLTETGRKLAEAYEQSISHTEYFKHWRLSSEPIPRKVLTEWGQFCSLDVSGPDSVILQQLFIQTNTKDKEKKRQNETLEMIRFVINHENKMLTQAEWRELLITDKWPSSGEKIVWNESLQSTIIGWRIYQIRQLFTYSLEAIWSYVLVLISNRVLTKDELIAKVFQEAKEQQINVEVTIKTKLCERIVEKDINDIVAKIRKEEPSFKTHVYYPLLLLLDVYHRMKEQSGWSTFHQSFNHRGGVDNISLSKWTNTVEKFIDHSMKDMLIYTIRYFILQQHYKVALQKMVQSGNETFHYIEEEEKLFFIDNNSPSFTVFRINQAVSVLNDLSLLEVEG